METIFRLEGTRRRPFVCGRGSGCAGSSDALSVAHLYLQVHAPLRHCALMAEALCMDEGNVPQDVDRHPLRHTATAPQRRIWCMDPCAKR